MLNCITKKGFYLIVFLLTSVFAYAQVPANINSGNPNSPFPQFLDYNAGALKTLASSGKHPEGVTHAEMELRIREAYGMICNDMTYNVNQNGTYGPLTVNGVKYIMPNVNPNIIQHCTCVEGDGYYLLAAAYMADKATFDGYYMWMHDRQFQKTIRFVDGVMNSPTYGYSPGISGAGSALSPTNVYGGALSGNSATDGDEDLAMALVVAWKQWGDNAVICTDPIQGTITYKNEALKYLKTMVDTVLFPLALPIQTYNSGIIGLDGYLKNGDSWNEITDWAAGSSYLGINRQVSGNQFLYMDYSAPSYFNTFSKVLTANSSQQFLIDQYNRASASCDWLVGQMASQNLIGFAGQMNLSTSNVPSFTSFSDGEDFRVGWRTVLNYVWNGNPTTSWNPVAHQPVAGGNTFELNLAKNNEKFLLSPQTYYAPDPQAPYTLPTLNLDICGPSTMTTYQPPTGANSTYFRLNKAFGPFSVSALAVQNFPLMAQMYRKCEITWDGADVGQQYLNSKPLYFHEFYRFLGMMVSTGNWHNPLDMIPTANMKVYKSVNKTYAYHGDTLTYTISYRNFGKPDATNVVIADALPSGLTYLSQISAGPGVSVSNSGGSLTWTIATVSGTNIGIPSNLNKTMDSIVFKVLVNNTATGRLCNTATITTSNGTGATSNEYPNHITETMERNCVDILTDNPISIKKSASKSLVQVGDTLSYTIVVKNKSVGFLNGGRPGVRVSVGLQPFTNPAQELKMDFRVFHGADEAYINLKNYRVSYFLQEPGPPNWLVAVANAEGFGTTNPTIGTQTLTPGTGYNQRFFITFPDQLTTVTQHLAEYAGGTGMIHRGALTPPRLSARVYTNPTGSFNFLDDWSYGTELNGTSGSSDLLTLITNDWTDPNNPNIPINKYHPEACGTTTRLSNKLLVEEFDGYTWRRAYGNSPVAGRELLNVKVIDSLPNGVVFGGFNPGYSVGTVAGNKIAWPTITQMLVNDSIVYKFWVTVKDAAFFGCPNSPTPADLINTAYASATNEQTVKDTAKTAVTCTAVFIPLKNFTKTADKASYNAGDPITYTIGWKNTQGSIVSSVGTGSNWKQVTGNPFTFSGGNMLINGVGPNGATVSNLMINNASHGMNGVIKSSIALSQYQSNYALVFRQNGNKWYEIRLSQVYNGIQISLWDYGYTTAGTFTQLMATTTNTAFPAGFTIVDIQLTLLNGQASFSVVNGGVKMPGVAQYTQLGLQKVAGYAGWRSDNNSSSTVSAWNTNLDSAFDIRLTDPIPSDVTFVAANNAVLTGCASCGSTPVVGTNVAGTVTYSQLLGPILYNDSITYTWQGTVASCPSNGKILNIASMAINGITPSILAANTVMCGSVTPSCVPPTTVTVTTSKPALCKGATLTVKGTASPANANYFYTWYRNGVAVTTASKTYSDFSKAITVVADSGTYTLRVEDGNAGSALCYKEKSVKVGIDTIGVAGKIFSSRELCLPFGAYFYGLIQSGTIGTGAISVKYYKWQSSLVSGNGPWKDLNSFSQFAAQVSVIKNDLKGTTYIRRVDSSGVCANVFTNVDTIRVNNTPLLSKITPVLKDTLCAGGDFNLSTSMKLSDSTGVYASKNGGYYFTWEHLRAGVVVSTSGPLPYKNLLNSTRAVVLADSGLYRLIVQDGIGAKKCQDTLTIRIVVNQAPTIKASIAQHQELCKGDAAKPITEIQAVGNYFGSLYTQWYTTKDTIGRPILTKIVTAGTGIDYNPGSPVTTDYYVRKDSVQYCAAVATNFIKVRVNNSLKSDTILPLEGDTLCISAGSNFQLKGVVDSLGKSSINGGYYFTWMHLQKPSKVAVVVGTPGKYVDYPPTSRLAALSDSGTYYLIVQDGVGATKCADTLKTKVVVIQTCTNIVPTCKKPVLVSTTLVGKDTLCVGNTFTIKKNVIDTSAGPSLSGYYFSWLRINSAGSVVVSAASRTYSDLVVNNVTPLDSGRYYLVVADGNGNKAACKESSAAISIVVHAPLTKAVISSSDTICSGSVPSLFTGTLQTAGTYQWYASSDSFKTSGSVQKLTGSILSTYQSGALTASAYFIRKDSVAACASVTSNILTLQVDQQITSGTIAKDTTICSGGTIHLRGLTVPTGGKPLYTYGWERSTTSLTTGFSSVIGTDTFYVFNNSVVATQLAPGTYYFRRSVTDVSTCSKVYSVAVAVKITSGLVQSPNASDTLTVCSNTTPTISGPAANASNATNPGGLNYQWQIRNGSGVFVNVPSGGTSLSYVVPSALTSDTMYRRISAAGVSACDSGIVKVYLKVYKPLKGGKLQHAGAGPICRGIGTSVALNDSVSISGGGGSNTIIWEKYNPATLAWYVIGGSLKNTSYTTANLDSVDFMIRRKVVDGTCTSIAYSDTVTVKVNDLKVSLNDPGTLCVGKSAILTAQSNIPGTTFVWTVDGSMAVGSSNSGTYTYTGVFADSSKVLKVLVTTAGNCTNSAQVKLTIVKAAAPSVTISTPFYPICEGYPINFVATATGAGTSPTYQWYVVPSSGTAQQVGTNAASYMSTPLVTGDQVYVEVTSSLSCALLPNPATSNKITMTVLPVPKPSIVEQNDTLCVPGTPSSKVFSVVPTSIGNTVQWYYNGSPIAGATSFTFTASNAGTYSVQESNAACNAISPSRTLTLIPTPIANAGPDVYLPEGAVSALDGSGGAIYSWTPATYLSSVTVSNPIYKATKTITYELTVTDATGKCKSTDDVTVYVVKPITVPNVITVNGDGVNDTWEIENIHGYPHSIIEIYNRWGNLVWKAEGYPKNWDGTNFRNGEVLPDGTYFYIINLHSDVYPEPKTGWVQIIK
jgi:gliding motility-associated-like protein/uncharacterized repeat protein (TIGR01451 family)